jgi:hypothetical protein
VDLLAAIVAPSEFKLGWDSLRIAIYISLLGSMIGHLKANGNVQMPFILIDYKKPTFLSSRRFMQPMNIVFLIIDFVLFFLGIRTGNNKDSESVILELGFIENLIVGVGAGVLAFATMGITKTDNIFMLISTAFLAGYGGFSYIQSVSTNNFDKSAEGSSNKHEDIVISKEPSPTTKTNNNEKLTENITDSIGVESLIPNKTNPFNEIKTAEEQVAAGKILVSQNVKNDLDHLFNTMNDQSLSLHQRRIAKIKYDSLYKKVSKRKS